MKKTKIFIALVLIAMISTTSNGGNGNGNGPQNGSGGNTNNNGNGTSVLIYHNHGNNIYSMMSVTPGSVAGHAGHGDLWYFTGCPLSGQEHCY